jgi:hypothetical protein
LQANINQTKNSEIMETKKTTKVATPKSKTAKNGVVKKRISKIMKAAEKYKGAFDMDEVLSYVNSKY